MDMEKGLREGAPQVDRRKASKQVGDKLLKEILYWSGPKVNARLLCNELARALVLGFALTLLVLLVQGMQSSTVRIAPGTVLSVTFNGTTHNVVDTTPLPHPLEITLPPSLPTTQAVLLAVSTTLLFASFIMMSVAAATEHFEQQVWLQVEAAAA